MCGSNHNNNSISKHAHRLQYLATSISDGIIRRDSYAKVSVVQTDFFKLEPSKVACKNLYYGTKTQNIVEINNHAII